MILKILFFFSWLHQPQLTKSHQEICFEAISFCHISSHKLYSFRIRIDHEFHFKIF